ncbi:MAG: hypothetical protein N3Z28_00705 [Synechococcaceae cyanobacterium MAG-AL2]|uniref:hypothetical protein n=1 Tax=Candidatus Regnicoccus frigidus TaxID=3074015 RepID=UPI002833C719|nr:hypothetical protein [Candidatus Regnicoccus frigidus]MCT4366173.1 hypothetical protein [Candidatus Regnicoccus frigidus MAG-AL2]
MSKEEPFPGDLVSVGLRPDGSMLLRRGGGHLEIATVDQGLAAIAAVQRSTATHKNTMNNDQKQPVKQSAAEAKLIDAEEKLLYALEKSLGVLRVQQEEDSEDTDQSPGPLDIVAIGLRPDGSLLLKRANGSFTLATDPSTLDADDFSLVISVLFEVLDLKMTEASINGIEPSSLPAVLELLAMVLAAEGRVVDPFSGCIASCVAKLN